MIPPAGCSGKPHPSKAYLHRHLWSATHWQSVMRHDCVDSLDLCPVRIFLGLVSNAFHQRGELFERMPVNRPAYRDCSNPPRESSDQEHVRQVVPNKALSDTDRAFTAAFAVPPCHRRAGLRRGRTGVQGGSSPDREEAIPGNSFNPFSDRPSTADARLRRKAGFEQQRHKDGELFPKPQDQCLRSQGAPRASLIQRGLNPSSPHQPRQNWPNRFSTIFRKAKPRAKPGPAPRP